MQTEISFALRPSERILIEKIAHRAMGLQRDAERPVRLRRKQVDFEMDVTATHANGCALDLERLLAADDFNFAHDIFGIERHLNRETGQLEDCFLPRFHLKAQEPLSTDTPRMRETIAAKREAFEARKGRKRGGGNSRRGRAARRAQQAPE